MLNMTPPQPPLNRAEVLGTLLGEGETWGDAGLWLPSLPSESVDLFFTSPPYADARSYSRIAPENYVEWFLPHATAIRAATKSHGWFILNIKNRVAKSGPLVGQRHPYVYELVLALQEMGWRWVETYIWKKPNAVPGRFGPRTKDAFEYCYAFAKGKQPFFDLDAVRVPYRATEDEIARRKSDKLGRRNTEAGFGRDRTTTYLKGGADPGNVISVSQTYNQHYGAEGHTAAMPEGLASFFIKSCSALGGIVIDPFAGSGTTQLVARRLGRQAGGLDIHKDHVECALKRLACGNVEEEVGMIELAN